MTDLRIKLREDFILRNPLLTASGTYGYGDEIADLVNPELYGGIVTKSITLKPRAGNPPPRIAEVTSGMLNSIGLANIGVDKFLEEKAEFLADYGGKVIVNIAGSKEDEYVKVIKKLSDRQWIAAFEINVSCPNVTEGGIEFGKDPSILGRLVRKLRNTTDKFLIIKLSPNVTDIRVLALAAQENGADALSMINTVYGAAIDIYTRRPKINTVVGGLSGPAIKPIALANILKTYKEVDIPIIGIGGISCGADVIEFLLAGAYAVQIGTANFYNPGICAEALDFIKQYCMENKINCLQDIIGQVKV
ncbi:MAG TPA: dihydroorotate dehydrogenase [Candidatus Marinimicrobia bacterium]|nr:dihydroorotate dehydrogenase [Candidatus Neomarinimicrobiota bacterium]HRS51593.1 dihydroorotate dehydrogenase [Candidatus Neomarinimicrobiota bacterium]HRU92329.1 dihydroorotate dehydrogenase [Candidatus Neomarinimicrobiota bacterium]